MPRRRLTQEKQFDLVAEVSLVALQLTINLAIETLLLLIILRETTHESVNDAVGKHFLFFYLQTAMKKLK